MQSEMDQANAGLQWIDDQLQIISEKRGTKMTKEALAGAGKFNSSIFPNIKAGRSKPGRKFFENVAGGFNALGESSINASIVARNFGFGGNLEEVIEDDAARLIAHRLSKIKDSKVRREILKTIDNLLDIALRINNR